MQIETKLFFKYGTIYREVMNSPRIDACAFMKFGDTNSLIVVKQLFQLVKESAPSIIHVCPYTVSQSTYLDESFIIFFIIFQGLNVRNATIRAPQSKFLIFPSGDYKSMFFAYTENQEFLGAINFIVTIFSSEKETFG